MSTNIKQYWQADPEEKALIEIRTREDKAERAAKMLVKDLMKFYNFKLGDKARSRLELGLALFFESMSNTYMTDSELLSFVGAFGEGLDSPF